MATAGHQDAAPRLALHPDVEAQGAGATHSSSDGYGGKTELDENSLGEYELLDRYITRGGHQPEEELVEEHEHIPWWKFWKSGPEEDVAPESNKPPPEWLAADIRQGVNSSDVEMRRKRFGWNELTAEKENQLAKFLSFFQGPILYGE
jgi:H+-transporting ATPase